jgi:nucleoside phosphorylase
MTALPKEYAAMRVMLENAKPYQAAGQGAGRRYYLGEIPAVTGGRHQVALTLADMGTNIAAVRAARLLEHFPTARSLIMVGIAGGIPHPTKPDEHVRLGDIIVSNQKGVVQYDLVREELKDEVVETTHRNPPRPPSASLLEAVQLLAAEELLGERPWLAHIQRAANLPNAARPEVALDILVDGAGQPIAHPIDRKRVEGQPRVFVGPIASANVLLKNPHKRDDLRDKFGVKAVEMEASGVADATWNHEIGYLVVRGICDYCDKNKNDLWQEYAAVVAAAYTRALIESMPV